jgi:hypothetical protein
MAKVTNAISQLIDHEIAVDIDDDLLDLIIAANMKGWKLDKLEKDFWLTVCLQYLTRACPELAFK